MYYIGIDLGGTNVAAGVVSWVCVIVGIVVIFAVIVSTKLSDYRAGRRV